MAKKLIVDNLGTTLHRHMIDKDLGIVVIEQYDKTTGVVEFTLKINHFGKYRSENPIRIYTNVPKV